jgi:hypothetical protein
VAPTIEEDNETYTGGISKEMRRVVPARRGGGWHQQGEPKTPNNNQEETCGRMEKTLRGQQQQEVGEVSPRWLNTPRRHVLEGS